MTWEDLKAHAIAIYSTPWCGDCRTLKRVLDGQGIVYTEIDIEADPAAADYLVKQTGKRAIPFVEIDGKVLIRGWHKEAPGRWDDAIFLAEVAAGLG